MLLKRYVNSNISIIISIDIDHNSHWIELASKILFVYVFGPCGLTWVLMGLNFYQENFSNAKQKCWLLDIVYTRNTHKIRCWRHVWRMRIYNTPVNPIPPLVVRLFIFVIKSRLKQNAQARQWSLCKPSSLWKYTRDKYFSIWRWVIRVKKTTHYVPYFT